MLAAVFSNWIAIRYVEPSYSSLHMEQCLGFITSGFLSLFAEPRRCPRVLGEVKLTIPLTLGVVAAALADLDDRLTGRLRNLIITLICFFIASASVELLFPWPWLFAIGLVSSTIGFILLGGLGQRYATIAFGALLIAVYTMLGDLAVRAMVSAATVATGWRHLV